jgi:hypothetical protein
MIWRLANPKSSVMLIQDHPAPHASAVLVSGPI